MDRDKRLVVGVTGATGSYATKLLVDASPWPVTLVMSRHGRSVYERECGSAQPLETAVDAVCRDDDLYAPIASGSVPTVGMVVLPCSIHTLGCVAGGQGNTLITRAAHCHLKERRPLILCVRETPWTAIDFDNARRVCSAGGSVMPLSPPYYMSTDLQPDSVTLHDVLASFVDRVLALLGRPTHTTWEDLC